MPDGTELRIVKLGPDGDEVTQYPGSVVATAAPAPWLVVRADWVKKIVEMDGLRFVPGDFIHEYFSPEHRFNVFAVFTPDRMLRGWYANVTHPSTLDVTCQPPTLYWHDLYVDVISLPDGSITVRDEDELDESGIQSREPRLFEAILNTRDEIVALAKARQFPFHES